MSLALSPQRVARGTAGMAGVFSPYAGGVAALAAANSLAEAILVDTAQGVRTPTNELIESYLRARADREPQSWPAALAPAGIRVLARQAGAAWARAGQRPCERS